MTEATEDQIDWAEVERRARAREPFVLLAVAAFFVVWAGISARFVGATGTAKWLIVAAYLLFFVALFAAQRLHPQLRARAAAGYRLQYALREHVDPGPGVREKVDRQATYMNRIVWFRWWLVLLIPIGLLMSARWDRPLITVPGALFVLALGVWAGLYMRRFYAAAEHWVADPPGPAREMPPLPRWQRWVSGWRFVVTLVLVVVTAVGAGVLAAVIW